ncbi:hypothetical protein [Nocardioides dilutus]
MPPSAPPRIRASYLALTVALASALALLGVIFALIGQFLVRVEGSGQIYGPSVFTNAKPKFWVTDELVGAAGVDGLWQEKHALVGPFVSWHLTLDFLFALLLGIALRRLLIAVTFRAPKGCPAPVVPGGTPLTGTWWQRRRRQLRRAWPVAKWHLAVAFLRKSPEDPLALEHVGGYVRARARSRLLWLYALPGSYVLLDEAETLATFFIFGCKPLGGGCDFGIGPGQAGLIHALSNLKWTALVLNLVVILLLYAWPGSEGAWSLRRSRLTRDERNKSSLAVGPPVGVVVLVLLLGLLLAVPGGGALDQMPDVVRAQIDNAGDEPQRILWSVLGLLLFMVTLATVCVPSTKPTEVKSIDNGNVVVVVVGAALSAALFFVHLAFEDIDESAFPVLAPALVAGAVLVVARLIRRMYLSFKEEAPEVATDEAPDITTDEAVTPVLADSYDQVARARVVTSLLVSGAVLIFCLAMVRAVVPLFMLTGPETTSDDLIMRIALLLALAAPALAALLCMVSLRDTWAEFNFSHLGWRLWVGTLTAVNLVAVVVLAIATSRSDDVGTVATLLFSVSAYVLLIGGLGALSRYWSWHQLTELGLGPRTPWLTLLVVVWLVMSAFSGRGYHDARTLSLDPGEADAPPLRRTLNVAVTDWGRQFTASELASCLRTPEGDGPGRVPLVLVASPGGGGKAAYWTALGMDKVFSDAGFCPENLFAASGVSGGSVGLTTALAQPPEASASDSVGLMTDEGPMAQTLSALLLRDLPRPFTTLSGSWRDRGAVLEDAWAAAAPDQVFSHKPGADDKEKNLTELGDGWWSARGGPVILLNGASVNDGCRVLVTNVRGISSGKSGCLTNPVTATGVAPVGAVSGSVDVLDGLLPSERSETRESLKNYCPTRSSSPDDVQTIRATTAALLSARFPFVTPSGALDTCLVPGGENINREDLPPNLDKTTTTYVVDGGYLENTGILTLLQVWDAVKPRVLRCNVAVTSGSGPSAGCPRDAEGKALLVEPWFVMLENHYRSRVNPPPPADRPKELAVPLATAGKRTTTVDTTPMEQALAIDISRAYGLNGVSACNRFVRLAPLLETEGEDGQPPKFSSVEAPLGWVLARDTQKGMFEALEASWRFNVQINDDAPPEFETLQERCP